MTLSVEGRLFTRDDPEFFNDEFDYSDPDLDFYEADFEDDYPRVEEMYDDE